MKVEKTKADLRYSLIEEQFHGCVRKRIKGACAQLNEGSGAFCLLYDVREGENDVELVLKPSCCGKETLSSFVAGVHFTEDDIRTFGHNKKVNGRALWAMGLTVLRSIKKALSIVPKLSPRIVRIDKNCAVIGYASGKNEHSFMQLVDNGMYAMTSIIGDDEPIVDVSDGLDDDNERIGAVSDEACMSVTRERVTGGDMLAKDDNDCDVVVVEEQTRDQSSWIVGIHSNVVDRLRHYLMAINLLMEKLEQLNADLVSMVLEVRLTNPIVGNVLDNAKKAMGLVTSTAKENDEKRKKIWGCQSVMRIARMKKMLMMLEIS
jgi:hypothetical protein